VPSSTSNSDPAGPAKFWLGTWLAVLVMVMLCLAAWEMTWRGRGFEPSLSDDAMLWSLARRDAAMGGRDAVVLVGSSRMQMDIHRETLSAAAGWRPAVQLAVVRGPARPVLESLAADDAFGGTVICEINPSLFYSDVAGFEGEIGRYIETYEHFTGFDWVEERLAILVQGNLVTRLPELSPIKIRRALLLRHAPTPRYEGVIGPDRYRYADYRRVPSLPALNRMIERQLSGSDPKLLDPRAFRARVARTRSQADRIVARGGRVIFLRLPSSGSVKRREDSWWPREIWWDALARATEDAESIGSIHYEDEPSLARFVPPDGDHLGKMQAIEFSSRLGQVLVRRGIAPGRSR